MSELTAGDRAVIIDKLVGLSGLRDKILAAKTDVKAAKIAQERIGMSWIGFGGPDGFGAASRASGIAGTAPDGRSGRITWDEAAAHIRRGNQLTLFGTEEALER